MCAVREATASIRRCKPPGRWYARSV